MKIENIEVYGFNASIRAMRNPMNSWGKSDSELLKDYKVLQNRYQENIEKFVLGENDMILSQNLTNAGGEHCKHLRLITVWFDITAPRFWYTEFDTYKHKENVSCSTMHKITSRQLTSEDFEGEVTVNNVKEINSYINKYKESFNEADSGDRRYWFMMIKNNLPEGYLQKRTVCTNYQTLYQMYCQRRQHKLPQWRLFCNSIKQLPYFTELTGEV